MSQYDNLEFDHDEGVLMARALLFTAMEPGFDTITLTDKERLALRSLGYFLMSRSVDLEISEGNESSDDHPHVPTMDLSGPEVSG